MGSRVLPHSVVQVDDIAKDVEKLEGACAFETAASRSAILLRAIKSLADESVQQEFLCNYLSMLVALERRIKDAGVRRHR